MKKIILMTACILLLCSCGEVPQESVNSSETENTNININTTASTETAIITDIPETSEIQTQTEITSSEIKTETVITTDITTNITTTSQTETEISKEETTEIQTAETFPEPENQPFETDENGAVIMEVEDDTEEKELIAAAQELYENACKTEFKYHVGCPYSLDYKNYIENQYGWQYYLVTSEGYNSISDVEKDYYKIFAEERGNDLSEIYMEQDGNLYALDGARGANIFYEDSEITGIIENTGEKITFSVDNHYSGNDKEPETPVTETEQFSVIIKNNEWRVAEFYLPY